MKQFLLQVIAYTEKQKGRSAKSILRQAQEYYKSLTVKKKK